MRRRSLFPFGAYNTNPGRFCTVPNNEPKGRPGCYGVYDLRNGKWYVGSTLNVADRRYDHEREVKHRGRMTFHFEARGSVESFVFVPLLYLVMDRWYLNEVETAMIYDLDSLTPSGYNQYASKRDEEYWRVMKTPEAKAKRRAKDAARAKRVFHTPEVTAKRNAALRNPEVQAAKSINQRKAFADPAFKKRQAAIMKEINSRPEVQAKRRASVQASWERRRLEHGPSGRKS